MKTYSHFGLGLFSCVLALMFLPALLSAQISLGSSAPTVSLAGQPDLDCSPSPCRLPNVQVSRGHKTIGAPNNIAADPNNPLRMIIGGADSSCASDGATYSTDDGGSTWTMSCLPELFHGEFDSVPVVLYDRMGAVHAFTSVYDLDDGPDEVYLTHSTDNGITWGTLRRVVPAIGQSAPLDWALMDNNPRSPFANTMYVSSTQYGDFNDVHISVSRSTDRGLTWQMVTAAKLPNTVFIFSEGFSHLALGNDGTLYLSWMESAAGSFAPNDMKFSKSTDGGITWSTPVLVYSATAVSMIPNTSLSARDFPVIAVDNGRGAFAGRLYITFYNWTGDFMQAVVTESSDGGDTWSTPVPVAPDTDTHDQFASFASVGLGGHVSVTWFDRRDDPANYQYRTYVAFSIDGGATWKKNIALAKVSSQPNFGLSLATNTWVDSTLYSAWADTSVRGRQQVFLGGYIE